MDPVGLQPDAEPAVEPAIHLPDNAGKLGVHAIGRNGLRGASSASLGDHPASNQRPANSRSAPSANAACPSRPPAAGWPKERCRTWPPDRQARPARQADRRPAAPAECRPSSFRRGSESAVQDQANDGFLLAFPAALQIPAVDHHAQPARYRRPAYQRGLNRPERCHAFCPLPTGFLHMAGARTALSTAVRPPSRRQISSHRGYGPPALTVDAIEAIHDGLSGLALRVTSRRSASRHARTPCRSRSCPPRGRCCLSLLPVGCRTAGAS